MVKEKTPQITVLMSVYNCERYLSEAIESILNQSFSDFEFLIINDGSTDNSRNIILSYADPRIRFFENEKNIGLTHSLNKGLRLATGQYIARMDADDVSMPKRLEKELTFLNQHHSVGLVGTYFNMINENGKVLNTVKPLSNERELKEKLLLENQFGHGSVMFRRVCVEKVGFYREKFFHG